MKGNEKLFRINLSFQANKSLIEMLDHLKATSKYVHLNPSRLASWVIVHFLENHFANDRERIIDLFFNQKLYFKEILEKLGKEEDVSLLLEKALEQIKSPHNKKVEKRKRMRKIGTNIVNGK